MLFRSPLQRFGTPEEVGHAVAFFASLQAGHITGQTLVVDGGQVLPESPLCFDTGAQRSPPRRGADPEERLPGERPITTVVCVAAG